MNGHILYKILNLIYLLVGLSMILWGLRIFKAYIILLGFLIFGLIGLGIFFFLGLGRGDSLNTLSFTLIGFFIGGIIGGAIAWPLQKLFVFLISGFFTAVVAVSISLAFGIEFNYGLLYSIAFFIIGGIISIRLYEYYIVIIMAISGVQAVFNYIHPQNYNIFSRGIDLNEIFRNLLESYSKHLLSFIITCAFFIIIALYFQKFWETKQEDSEISKRKKQ
ncbi:MAG: hypothetical protein JW969_12875 [Spirochaetales bacterium]|nr:hypothetical protein [Spirochaetales bacterium]